MIFANLDVEFSPNINVISGENSTGKTALIKLLYSVLKGFAEACTVKGDLTKDKLETALVDKLQGVFRPDNNAVGKSQTRKFEMGLVSEGYRKIATIMYLILSGSLSKNAVLFWDEPETNMNPKMIRPLVDAIIELAKMGVQVFVTTHDYFVQQCFNMAAMYPSLPKKGENAIKYNFLSLYKEEDCLQYEQKEYLSDLTHNAVMEEFDSLYDRKQELILLLNQKK